MQDNTFGSWYISRQTSQVIFLDSPCSVLQDWQEFGNFFSLNFAFSSWGTIVIQNSVISKAYAFPNGCHALSKCNNYIL